MHEQLGAEREHAADVDHRAALAQRLQRVVERRRASVVALADDERAHRVEPGPAGGGRRARGEPGDGALGEVVHRLAAARPPSPSRPRSSRAPRGRPRRRPATRARIRAIAASARRRVSGSMRVMFASAASVDPRRSGRRGERVELRLEHVGRLGRRTRSGRARPRAASSPGSAARPRSPRPAPRAGARPRPAGRTGTRRRRARAAPRRAAPAAPAPPAPAPGRSPPRRPRRAQPASLSRRDQPLERPLDHPPAGSAAPARRRGPASRPPRTAAAPPARARCARTAGPIPA